MALETSNPNPTRESLREAVPALPPRSLLLNSEPFSSRIKQCRERFLYEDGRFTSKQIANISGSSDGFDECSFHLVSGPPLQETGIMRVTVVSPLSDLEPRLPFQHFYPGYTEHLQPGDAEISRFVVAPGSRKGKSASLLIEAAFRLCAQQNVSRLFIDVVDGDLGIAPKSYEKHFGFQFTGATGYDDNYSCATYLMGLEGSDKICQVAERLTARLARM